jgi:4-hydroxy-2-oxoheptanedioate aldolase
MSLRAQWDAGASTLGAWVSVASSAIAEAAARLGFSYVCLDNQHGGIDYRDSLAMIQGVVLGGSNPVVRVPWNEQGIIGKMLDAGAEGVIVPMVNTVAEARAVVRSCRYAPEGARSFGPFVASLRTDARPAEVNARIAVIPMIETVEALANLDDILSVPGIDAVYVGPADLSLTLGLPPANNDDDPRFTEALEAIVAGCRRHGVVPGIHSNGTLAPRRLEQGFRMVTVTADLVAMRSRMAEELTQARGVGAEGAPGAGRDSTAVY